MAFGACFPGRYCHAISSDDQAGGFESRTLSVKSSRSRSLFSIHTRWHCARPVRHFALAAAVTLLIGLRVVAPLRGQEFFERYSDWPEQTTLRGTMCIAPSLKSLEGHVQALRSTIDCSRVVMIVGDGVEPPPELLDSAAQLAEQVDLFRWNEVGETAADACWLWYEPRRWDDLGPETQAKASEQLRAHLDRAGTVIVVDEIANWLGTQTVVPIAAADESGTAAAQLLPGIGLLDRTLLATAASAEELAKSDFQSSLNKAPGNMGLHLSSDSLLIILGRKMFVLGTGSARLHLARTGENEPMPVLLRGVSDGREVQLADWTQWRRRAIEQTLEPFPPLERQLPRVEAGSLLIVGGGGLPRGLMSRFVDLAGGSEHAKLVYVPCEEQERVAEDGILRQWRAMGVSHVSQVHTKDRQRANEDPTLLDPLRQATGIWFGGGRQWNLADSYYGTEAHRLMKQVLARGGVIGGSSAGASIQASYLARATPIGNFDVMAPGYERGGLGFILGVAIDQHFSQRNRQPDQLQLVERHRQLLGIGIDETTAIEVRNSRAEVLGEGRVYFAQWIEREGAEGGGAVDVVALAAGEAFDLADRKPVERKASE